MTILIASPRYEPHIGGIETLLNQVLPPLRDRGHEFVVIAGIDDGAPSADLVDGVPVYRLPYLAALRAADPPAILDLGRRVREVELAHGVTVRHVHGVDFGNWFVWRAHRRSWRPLVVSVHGVLERPQPYSRVTYNLLRDADRVTVVSDAVGDSIVGRLPELRGAIAKIPNALAPSPVPRRRWSGEGDLLAVGRLDETKGFDVAIEAMARLRGAASARRLLIAGDGVAWSQLAAQIARLGLEERVVLLGRVERVQVLELMSRAAAVIVPSRSIEGFSLVALEAAQLGRPVIASAVGGLPEVVRDGVTGWLVPPEDPDALAGAIAALLGDPARAAAVASRAPSIAAEYDLDECVDRYDTTYRALVTRTRVPRGIAAEAHV